MTSITWRKFDVVIWGATGFTGSLVVEYFSEVISKRHPTLRWAIAGRNPTKLQKIVDAIDGISPGVLVGSVTDRTSIDEITRQTKVVLSTAGPFVKIGTPIVDACIRNGCHYTDITGETPWVRSLIDKYDEVARSKGLFVVPMCGFDSIPSDLGCFFAAQALLREYQAPARSVRAYFTTNGGPSGGTLASGQNMMKSPELLKQFEDPYLLGGGTGTVGYCQEEADVKTAQFEKSLGVWTAPFGMAAINTRVVRRSIGLLGNTLYDRRGCIYNEVMIAPNEKLARRLEKPPPAVVIEKLIASGRLPKPGQGPDKAAREKTFFGVLYVARTADGRELLASLKGGDPGYTETSKMVSESAVSLALGRFDQSRLGGVLTPSTAFGNLLVTTLAKCGLRLKVEKVGKITPNDVRPVLMSFPVSTTVRMSVNGNELNRAFGSLLSPGAPSSPSVKMKGKVAVITGGADGIGLEAALRCLGMGMRVAICDIEVKALDNAKRRLLVAAGSDVSRVLTSVVDVAELAQVQRFRGEVSAAMGPAVHLLLANAGVGGAPSMTRAGRASHKQWRWVLEVDVFGVVYTVEEFLPLMRKEPAAIVNVSSVAGIISPTSDGSSVPYIVAKHSVRLYTEHLGLYARKHLPNLQVASLHPHYVVSKIFSSTRNLQSQWAEPELASNRARSGFYTQREMEKTSVPTAKCVDELMQGLCQGKHYIMCHDVDYYKGIPGSVPNHEYATAAEEALRLGWAPPVQKVGPFSGKYMPTSFKSMGAAVKAFKSEMKLKSKL